ncbi:MAG: TVP38/TMEM64 family protein [Mobilicoccus sp.]|nr:TVP38/TMEM64 family protein [Mobilicoccus sp.]
MSSPLPLDSPGDRRSRLWSWVRVAALIAFATLMVWVFFNVRLPDLEVMQAAIESYGWWGRVVFVAAYAVVGITPIPVTIMAVLAGLLFGVVEGSILAVIGSFLGCAAAYGIARGLGRETVLNLLGDRAEMLTRRLDSGGFAAVFLLRVMPGVPYWPVNYAGGALGVASRPYLAATLLACLPGQTSLVAIGALVVTPTILEWVVLVVAWLVVLGLTFWGWRELKQDRDENQAPDHSDSSSSGTT